MQSSSTPRDMLGRNENYMIVTHIMSKTTKSVSCFRIMGTTRLARAILFKRSLTKVLYQRLHQERAMHAS